MRWRDRAHGGFRTSLRWIVIAIAATACWALARRTLPMQYAIPGAALAVFTIVALLHRDATRRYAALVSRVEAIKGADERRASGAADPPRVAGG
jgi:chromate transport protein ChrA